MKRSGIRGQSQNNMVQYRRNRVPGGTYFFTVTLCDRRSTLLVDHINLLRRAFRVTQESMKFSMDAVVVLPDHLHAVWTMPQDDADFPARWKSIKSAFTRALVCVDAPLRKNSRGEYDLWQRRYWEHTIRDEVDFERHVNYIHYNPVKHRLVGRAADWPYSSFHRYVRLGRLGNDWAGKPDDESVFFGE